MKEQKDPGTATRALALSALVPAALLVPGHPLAAGGLSGLAGGLLVGALAGAPAARVEWRAGVLPAGWGSRFGEIVGTLLVGATLGPLASGVPSLAALGLALVALGAATARWGPRVLRPLLLVAALALAAAVAASGTPVGPWTLLEPRWEAAGAATATAVVLGALLAAGGLGVWSGTPWLPGVGWRRPLLPVGLGTLAGLAALIEVAWRAESAAEVPTAFTRIGIAAACLLGLAGAGAILARPGGGRGRLLSLLAAAAWFAGPGHQVLPFFWLVLLPIGLAVPLALRGTPGRVLAGLLALAVIVGWPGLPQTAGGAAAAAATVVVAFWAVATPQRLAQAPP